MAPHIIIAVFGQPSRAINFISGAQVKLLTHCQARPPACNNIYRRSGLSGGGRINLVGWDRQQKADFTYCTQQTQISSSGLDQNVVPMAQQNVYSILELIVLKYVIFNKSTFLSSPKY
jgi:hypothetical protein